MNKFKIISFLILTSFSSFSFAGAAEDRTQSIIDKAISTKSYSSATGHNYTVGGVKAANGQVSADITQRVTVDGSSASVKQKVSIPANDAFYKNTGKFAKNLLKGGIYGAAVAAAMGALLDGVDYVMDQGQIKSKPQEVLTGYYSPYLNIDFYDPSALASMLNDTSPSVTVTGCSFNRLLMTADCSWVRKPQFGSDSGVDRRQLLCNECSVEVKQVVPSDPEINDAFSNWFKNNPGSVTDPVTTYIYSPKTPTGAPATTPQTDPSFGQQEITDEMMDNYLANRNAELVNGKTAVIQDSTSTETSSNPDGSKTTTKNNPDGSKTETKTETKTNPDTGKVETTVTETVINPDGTKQPSKVTETKTETKPNPETSKLPAACEYFAVLCDWIGWTKENPDMPEENPLVPQELDIGSLNTGTFQATAGCPADIQVPVSFGGASKSIAISYEPICALAQKWSFIAPLIGFISGAMILIGVGRKGEDGDS